MKGMIIVALVIIGVIVSAIYTYLFQQVYTERYGRRGLSYVLAAILAAGIMWFSLEYEVPSGWEYKVSLAIIIVSALLNLIWIIRGLLKPDVPVGMKNKCCRFTDIVGNRNCRNNFYSTISFVCFWWWGQEGETIVLAR